ncbi:MAG: response regulator [Rectinemataceae bacterium]|nr:response regulator [Rectinemataceae bacterium]
MAVKGEVKDLGEGYYWVGSRDLADSLQCNPYLLVEGDEAVLFDPGSVLDVDEVAANIASIIPLEKVKYVVLHHQDPDLASAVPRLEALGMHFSIVTHWRTWSLVRFYGVVSPVYLIDEQGYALTLATGRALRFIPTPYLHFPGAVATYDKKARFLLSSDLFGAFAPSWSLYAGDAYMEGMKSFHEHYMPSHEVLKPVMEIFGCLDLAAILPQHGSIINKNIKTYIDALQSLECGTLLGSAEKYGLVKSDLPKLSERFQKASERLFTRFSAVFGNESALAVAGELGIKLDPSTGAFAESPIEAEVLWNRLSEAIYLLKGHSALAVLEPFVALLCEEYGIERPRIYGSILQKSEQTYENLGQEVAKLRAMNEQLSQTACQVDEAQIRDATTGFYDESFFRSFIDEQASLRLYHEGLEDDVLALFGVDEGMAEIEYQYGPREVESILKGVARILTEQKAANHPSFRMHGANFAIWMPGLLFHEASERCEEIRKSVESSKSFIEPITISVGLVAVAEIRSSVSEPAEAGETLTEIGLKRLRIAKRRGGNAVCSSSETDRNDTAKATILIVDDDETSLDVMRTFLENAGYFVATAADGAEALDRIGEESIDLVICELMVSKIDGFMLKEKLSRKSGTKNLPFILVSHRKNEDSVNRAYGHGVDYYLQKPFLLAELLGIVKKLTSSGMGR